MHTTALTNTAPKAHAAVGNSRKDSPSAPQAWGREPNTTDTHKSAQSPEAAAETQASANAHPVSAPTRTRSVELSWLASPVPKFIAVISRATYARFAERPRPPAGAACTSLMPRETKDGGPGPVQRLVWRRFADTPSS